MTNEGDSGLFETAQQLGKGNTQFQALWQVMQLYGEVQGDYRAQQSMLSSERDRVTAMEGRLDAVERVVGEIVQKGQTDDAVKQATKGGIVVTWKTVGAVLTVVIPIIAGIGALMESAWGFLKAALER